MAHLGGVSAGPQGVIHVLSPSTGKSCFLSWIAKKNGKEKDDDHDQDSLKKAFWHIWSWSSDLWKFVSGKEKTMTMTKISSKKTCYTYGHGPLINPFQKSKTIRKCADHQDIAYACRCSLDSRPTLAPFKIVMCPCHLEQGGQRRPFVRYRDSKLTFLLRDCGRCWALSDRER